MEKSYRLLKMKSFLSMLLLVNVPAVLHGGGGPDGCIATPNGRQLIIDIDEDFRQARKTLSVYASVENATVTIPPVDVLESATWDTENKEFICHFDKLYVSKCIISKSGTRIKLYLEQRFEKYLVQQRPSSNPKDTQKVSFTCFDPFAFSMPLKQENTSDTSMYIVWAVAFLLIIGVIVWLVIQHYFLWARQKKRTQGICPKTAGAPKLSPISGSDLSINIPEKEGEKSVEQTNSEIMDEIKSLKMQLEQVKTEMGSHATENIRSLADKKKEESDLMKSEIVSLKTEMEEMKTEIVSLKTQMEEMKTEIVSLKTQAAPDLVETGIVQLHDDLDPQVASENPESYTVATKFVESLWSQPINATSGAQSDLQRLVNDSRPSPAPPPTHKKGMVTQSAGPSQTLTQVAAAPVSGGCKARANSTEDQAVTVSTSSHAPSPEKAPRDSPHPFALKSQPAICNDAATTSGAQSDLQRPSPSPAPPPTHKKGMVTQSGPSRTPTQGMSGDHAMQAAMATQLDKFHTKKRGERPPWAAKPTPPAKSQLALNQVPSSPRAGPNPTN